MVKHKGLCPSLKKSVEFDVNEIIELKTKRGVKYQVKGDYEGSEPAQLFVAKRRLWN